MQRWLIAGSCLAMFACATVSIPPPQRYLLTTDVLDASGAHDLYDAVARLRPQWLDPCAAVFHGDRFWGGTAALREFRPGDVRAVHYIPRGHPRPGAGSTALAAECAAIQVVT